MAAAPRSPKPMYDVSLLRSNRPFRLFWGVEAVETLATGLKDVALPWFVLAVTGSPLQLAVAFALRSAPDVLVAPLIGGLLDRHSRTRLLAVGHAGTALLTAALPVLFLAGRLRVGHVYLVMLGLSVTGSLSHNASRAALPELVEDPRLDEANALLQGTRSAGRLSFLLAGGASTVALGPARTLLAAVAGSALAAVLPTLLPLGGTPTGAAAGLRAYLADFREGVRTVRSTTVLLHLLAFGVAYNLFVVPFASVVLPAAARVALGGAGALTVLLACWRGGSLLGNAVAGRLSVGPRSKMVVGVLVVGAGTLAAGTALRLGVPAVGGADSSWLAVVAVAAPLFAAGVGQPLFNVPGSSLLQARAPDRRRGTVVTLQNSLLQASFPVPLVAAGALLAVHPPGTVLIGAGVGLLALAAVIAARFEDAA